LVGVWGGWGGGGGGGAWLTDECVSEWMGIR